MAISKRKTLIPVVAAVLLGAAASVNAADARTANAPPATGAAYLMAANTDGGQAPNYAAGNGVGGYAVHAFGVPEPSSITVFFGGIALLGLGYCVRRRRHNRG